MPVVPMKHLGGAGENAGTLVGDAAAALSFARYGRLGLA